MKKEFRVSSDLSKVQETSSDVLGFLKPAGLSESALYDIRLCLEEALINAMKYGNGLDRSKPVRLDVEFDKRQVRVSVEDEGPGFSPRKLADCTRDDNLLKGSGRGVHLIRHLMDRVEYNEKGNRVMMVKYLS